ncbi:MAG: ATP-dependent DNA helicase RecG [Candidatus Magasanikbacteria bacterium]
MQLHTPVAKLNRVGSTLEKRLRHLGIETAQDLLFYFPFRYEDFSQLRKIEELKDGEQVTIKGKIELIANKRSPRKRTMITEAVVADETEQIKVVWFGQPFITKTLKPGDTVYLSGKITSDMFGRQMVGPAYEKVIDLTPNPSPYKGEGRPATTHTARIVPMYSLTTGITQKQLRFLMSQVIDLVDELEDYLPEDLKEKADVMNLGEAIRAIHFPESDEEMKHALRRLKFDELFLLQLRGEMVRQQIKKSTAPEIKFKEKEIKQFVKKLPFELTKKQKISAWEILQDMEKPEPMNRLLEGDVGSGKTVVAVMALYNAVLNGYQAVIMAPTEVLAFQHYESLKELLGSSNVSIGLLTRSKFEIFNLKFKNNFKLPNDKMTKKTVVNAINLGDVDIIVGTHALLTDKVEFRDLGLVIVDEQHRFGVEQRKTIKEKTVGQANTPLTPLPGGESVITPHFLSMTATPIPRSFALTLYGDLDLSIIDEMPADRKLVKTRLVDPHNREKAYGFIREQVKQGRQVFVVCPLISQKSKVKSQKSEDVNESDINRNLVVTSEDDKKTVLSEYEKLSKKIFPDLKIGFLHGKLKSAEKDETMNKFAGGEIDILVSTSVIEVGVNIPNASVMMIEGAERFGLAQLHQFRGRVGRAEHQSYCFLFTDSDTLKVKERLSYFEKENSGFKVAEYDLEQRGPGEVFGTTQSGMKNFKLATMQDHELIKLSRDLARGIDFGKYLKLREKVEEWEESVHLE